MNKKEEQIVFTALIVEANCTEQNNQFKKAEPTTLILTKMALKKYIRATKKGDTPYPADFFDNCLRLVEDAIEHKK